MGWRIDRVRRRRGRDEARQQRRGSNRSDACREPTPPQIRVRQIQYDQEIAWVLVWITQLTVVLVRCVLVLRCFYQAVQITERGRVGVNVVSVVVDQNRFSAKRTQRKHGCRSQHDRQAHGTAAKMDRDKGSPTSHESTYVKSHRRKTHRSMPVYVKRAGTVK